jgi:transposase
VFYLPSYSPELNPEERLNADLKHVIRSKVPVRQIRRMNLFEGRINRCEEGNEKYPYNFASQRIKE